MFTSFQLVSKWPYVSQLYPILTFHAFHWCLSQDRIIKQQ